MTDISQDIADDIKRVAHLLGQHALSLAEYLQQGRFTRHQVYRDGNTWQGRCASAGVDSKARRKPVPDETYYQRLAKAYETLGRYPKASEWKSFNLEFDKGRIPGGWKTFVEKAVALGYVPGLAKPHDSAPPSALLRASDDEKEGRVPKPAGQALALQILRATRDIRGRIVTERNRSRLLHTMCENLVRASRYRSACIMLPDDSGKLVTIAHDDPSEGSEAQSEWAYDYDKLEACAQRALKQPEVVLVEDQWFARAEAASGGLQGAAGTGAMMIRLEHGGDLYGLLVVSAPKALIREEEERSLFSDIARDLSFALWGFQQRQAREHAEMSCKRSGREIGIGKRITEAFVAWPGDSAYGEVLEILLEATGSKRGVFGYIDENGSYVVPSTTPQVENEAPNESGAPHASRVFPESAWGDTAGARAIRERRTIRSNRSPSVAHGTHVPIHRSVSLPIIHWKEVIGLLQVANKETDYDQNDIALLETAVEFIAPFLASRLRQEAKEDLPKQERTAQPDPVDEPMEPETLAPKWVGDRAHGQNASLEPLDEITQETPIGQNEEADRELHAPRQARSGALLFGLDTLKAIGAFARAIGARKPDGPSRLLRHVLLVSGNTTTVESVTSALRTAEDVAMVGVANPREKGPAMAQDLAPEVIIVDLSPGGMGGLHSIHDLRQELPEVYIVAMCPWKTRSLEHSALESGADSFILTSRSNTDLLPAIRAGKRHESSIDE